MHIELGLGESRIRYEAGDHVGDEDVAIFIGDDSSNKMILMIKGG